MRYLLWNKMEELRVDVRYVKCYQIAAVNATKAEFPVRWRKRCIGRKLAMKCDVGMQEKKSLKRKKGKEKSMVKAKLMTPLRV